MLVLDDLVAAGVDESNPAAARRIRELYYGTTPLTIRTLRLTKAVFGPAGICGHR